MLTEVGVMGPFTLLARIAYGTLPIVCRGVISGSVPTVTPRKSTEPSIRAAGNGTDSPSRAEKYPSSGVMDWVSVQSAVPPVACG
jgi:hypothetical protein